MAGGMSFSFPSLLFHEGRTYGQPEVVPISLPQVSTGLRSRLPGSFRRRGFQPDLLMPQEGNRIFTGRAVTTNGLLSNNGCKGYCKNWIAFIQPGMKTFAENTGKWQKCCTQPCILL